jgi:hypothetical protein
VSARGQHQVLFSYGDGELALQNRPLSLVGVTIGPTTDYSDAAVGLDGSIYVKAPSNTANRYLISARSSTPTEQYSVGSFGFIPVHRITQRISSPFTVAFYNAGGLFGYFDNIGDGTYHSSALSITGARGVTWNGVDVGYAGSDLASSLIAYRFNIGGGSKSIVDTVGGNPLVLIQDHNPGGIIYCTRVNGDVFLGIDTADDSVDTIDGTVSPALLTPTQSCLIASDGYMYALRSHAGPTKKLERFDVSDGSSVGELSLGNPSVADYLYESPVDDRLWLRMSYLDNTVRMVGVNKATLQIEAYSVTIDDGVSTSKIPLGFTSTGLLAFTGANDGSGNLIYYTMRT